MKMQIKKILQQPLLHFLAIGALLFALYYMVNPSANNKDRIVINDEQIERMELVFEKEWNRPPTEEEMKGLLDRYIQQEVYYRKALRMNLDQNDEIIRRRLDQKLRFLTNDMANLTEPSPEELQAFYQTNKTKYLEQKKYSFSHIYFSPDKRKNPDEDAANVLKTLNGSDKNLSELIKKGDAFPFASHIDSLTQEEINTGMGDGFTDALDKLPIGKWSGPVFSGYGTHLIFLNEIKPPHEKDFASIREEVLRDFHYKLQEDYNKQLFQEFKKDFKIEVNINDPKNNKALIQKLIAANDK